MLQDVIPRTLPDVMRSWVHTILGSITIVVLTVILFVLLRVQLWRLAQYADILEERGPNAGGAMNSFHNARRAWNSRGKLFRLINALDRAVPATTWAASRLRDCGQGRESFAEAMLVPERDQTCLGCRPLLFRKQFLVPAAVSLSLSLVTAGVSVVFNMADSAWPVQAWHITWMTLFGFYIGWLKRLFAPTFLGLHMVALAYSFHGGNMWLPLKTYLDQIHPSWSAHCVMTHGTGSTVPYTATWEINCLLVGVYVWLGFTVIY